MEEGWAKDDYYYYSPSIQKEIKSTGWGGGGLVWGECTRSDPKVVGYNIIESFFIGTEQQFKDIGYKTNPTILNGFRN